MNHIRFSLLLLILLAEIKSSYVLRTQFSPDHKYCLDDSGTLDNVINSISSGAYILGEFLEIAGHIAGFKKYNNYEEANNAQMQREREFRKANPQFGLRNYAESNGINCVLYDKKIEILNDGSIVETPYNFRPLK